MQPIRNINLKEKLITILFKRVSILQWLPKYNRTDFICDLISGITIGMTMMPQSIAYASLAELTAEYGLYSAFMGCLIYVIFGTIKEVSIGPTSLMALLSLSYTRNLPVDFMILLAFLSGCVEFAMGLLNLGFLVDFISAPVVSGFTSATSVIIIVAQLKGLFGLSFRSHGFLDTLRYSFTHVKDMKISDTTVGICSMIFLLCLRKLKDVPVKSKVLKKTLWFLSTGRNALCVLICSVIGYCLYEEGTTPPFRLAGKVPSGLPNFKFPNMTTTFEDKTYTFLEMCETLGSGIILVPLVAVLANVAIAKSFAAGSIVDASQEMMTLGLCNIFGSFVQAMPTCGAFTRSAVSNASGVRTPLAGLYTGTLIILALTFLTPYFYYIPKATLAAVLICAVIFMIDYQIIMPLWRSNKFDLFLTGITFVLSLCFGVETGLLCGVVINIIFLLKLWARPTIHSQICTYESNEYILIKPEVGLFFPAVDAMRTTICKVAIKKGKNQLPILIDCSGILHIDYTAHKGIENLIKTFDKKNQLLLFLDVNPLVLNKIKKITDVDDYQFCYNMNEALHRMFGEKMKNDDDNCPLLFKENNKNNMLSLHNNIRKYSLYDDIRLCSTEVFKGDEKCTV